MAATLIPPFAAQPLRASLRAGGVLRTRTTVMTLLTVDCKASTMGTVQRSFCICRNVCFKDLQLQLNRYALFLLFFFFFLLCISTLIPLSLSFLLCISSLIPLSLSFLLYVSSLIPLSLSFLIFFSSLSSFY